MPVDLTIWMDLRDLSTVQAVAGVIPRVSNVLAPYGPTVETKKWTLQGMSGDTGVIGFTVTGIPEDPGGERLAQDIVRDFVNASPRGLQYGIRIDAQNADAGDQGDMNLTWMRTGSRDGEDQIEFEIPAVFERIRNGERLTGSP